MSFQPARSARFCAAMAAIGLLGACGSASDEAAAPAPTPSLTSQALPTESADGAPITPGSWNVEEAATGASAAFGDAGAEPLLVVACNRNTHTVTLTRATAITTPTRMRIAVGANKADLDLTAGQQPLPGLTAAIDPNQPIFTALADPAANATFVAPGLDPINLPGHAGIARVLESCR